MAGVHEVKNILLIAGMPQSHFPDTTPTTKYLYNLLNIGYLPVAAAKRKNIVCEHLKVNVFPIKKFINSAYV